MPMAMGLTVAEGETSGLNEEARKNAIKVVQKRLKDLSDLQKVPTQLPHTLFRKVDKAVSRADTARCRSSS